ncbi:hypothetical protein [uncultured Celeribacter sp.]|uniref:hypothetical protein n=1 Tax=uncultured Celeribacter sp. TaxID=1303376 RepID=UPI002AA884A9|nr:hypothetical protein [uncultured Celeribacter sp.]
MTLRVCVLGDAHIAAFALAAEQNALRWPDLRVDVFGVPGDGLSRFDVVEDGEGGRFASTDAELRARVMAWIGRDSFALSEYAAFVVTGAGASILPVVEMFSQLSSLAMPSVEDAMTALEAGQPLASTAMLRAMTREALGGSGTYDLARKFQTASIKAPVFLASAPRPAAEPDISVGSADLRARGDGPFVSEWYDREAEAMCQALGVRYLPQPRQSRAPDGLFTHVSYMRALASTEAVSEDKGRPDASDLWYANAAYACLVIDQLAHALNLIIVS